MARRKVAAKRKILPDPRYGNEMLAKFVNYAMLDGKKSAAEKIVYGALDRISEKLKGKPLELFEKALENIRPRVELRARRVGGATYQIPVELSPSRQLTKAMKWLLSSARRRSEKGMINRLVAEMLDAIEGKGAAVKKRQDEEKMAEANKAFAHYRW